MTALLVAVLVAVAGGLGAGARFLVDTGVARQNRLSVPLGTLLVNVSACLLLGALTGLTAGGASPGELRAVIGVGFLGGYSTFSTASVEAARLVRAGRGWTAVLHAGGMLLACTSAALVGLLLTGA